MTTDARTRYVFTTTNGKKLLERSPQGIGVVPTAGSVLWVERSSKDRAWYEVRSVVIGFPQGDLECAIHVVVEEIERKPESSFLSPPSLNSVGEPQKVRIGENSVYNFEDGLNVAVNSTTPPQVRIQLSERSVATKTDEEATLGVGQQVQYRSKSRNVVWVVTFDGGSFSSSLFSVECFSYK